MRLVFLGSPPFATPVLAHLARSEFRPELVVTPPARRRGRGRKEQLSPLAALAREHGLPLEQPERVGAPELHARLRALDADYFLVVSYGELLRQDFLDLPREECLNVHPSLLPRWRGASPIQAALAAGDEQTGVSIQRVVLELDAGDMLAARRTTITRGETAGELGERLAALSGELCIEAFSALEAGRAVYTPQDSGQVTQCRKLSKEGGRIDWSRSALELERHVLAMNPWPGACTVLPDGRTLSVWRARAAEDRAPFHVAPGTLLAADGRFVVAATGGALELTEVQAAGKKALAAGDFLRGMRLAPGARLE